MGVGVPGFQCHTDACGGHWVSSLLPHQLPVTYPFFLSDWHLRPYTPHRCVHTSLEIWRFPERLCKDPLPLFIKFSLCGLQIIMGPICHPVLRLSVRFLFTNRKETSVHLLVSLLVPGKCLPGPEESSSLIIPCDSLLPGFSFFPKAPSFLEALGLFCP